jgi:ribosome-associated toxin RatA of RatAB toxin-antitoxin module
MKELRRTALVPQSAATMYALVNDIARYPEFVPGCTSAEILERGPDELIARVGVQRGNLSSEFTTRNQLISDRSMRMNLVSGPFRHFEGVWSFKPVGAGGCEIELLLRYDFPNPIKRALLQPLIGQTADQLVQAFVRRAQQLDIAATDL